MNVTHYPAALHIKCFRIHKLELHKVIYRKYHCLIYILMNVAILSSSCNLTNATLRHEDITVLFSCLHTFFNFASFFQKLYTQIQELHTKCKMPHISKYHKRISKAHHCCNINSCWICVLHRELCVAFG